MKKDLFYAILLTVPIQIATSIPLGILWPTEVEDRIPGLFELSLVISFFIGFLIIRNRHRIKSIFS